MPGKEGARREQKVGNVAQQDGEKRVNKMVRTPELDAELGQSGWGFCQPYNFRRQHAATIP